MKKGKISALRILGILLILIGAGGMLLLQWNSHRAARSARETADRLGAILPERSPGIPGEYADAAMPSLELSGKDYSGLLEVPAWGVKLPIADQWNPDMVLFTPCRYYGSVYDSNLILGGGNQPGQFDFCGKIDIGEVLLVTDMTGAEFRYAVSRVDRAGTVDSEKLLEGDWALTLFVRDGYDNKFILVRCNPA